MSSLIDIGVNLTHKSFNTDCDQVVKEAQSQGVSRMIVTGSCVERSRASLQMAKLWPGVLYSTAGVHPHDVTSCNDSTISNLRELASEKEVVAIGECGLDYFRDFSPREDQKKWFEAQLQTAVEIELPVFLHQRDAHKDFISILKRYIQKLPAAVVHCFTGTAEEMEESLEMGCYIGITGWICDERRGKNLQSIVKDIPLSKLMVETDAPF
ncbi:MAG TPA: hydrolase TatD, partial [Verrucomicrobia bacterium]|nr:hydrolase TatD [Verrucomicrobiota bacterium]